MSPITSSSKRTAPRIRVEAESDLGHHSRVYFVPADGEEIDISSCVTGVEFSSHVGEVNRATLHVVLTGGRANTEVEKVVVKQIIGESLRGRIRRWLRLRDVVDVTPLGASYREYVKR